MCGVFGVMGKEPSYSTLYHGMEKLQHRGQDSVGIFSCNSQTGCYRLDKSLGLLRENFTKESPPLPSANWLLGHLRYPTAGKNDVAYAQPFLFEKGPIMAIAHNGHIDHTGDIKSKNLQLETKSDSELILKLLCHLLGNKKIDFESLCEGVAELFGLIQGAYAVVGILVGYGMFAFRDPLGFRPLAIGKSQDERAYCISSEDHAIGAPFGSIEHLKPGELVFIDNDYRLYRRQLKEQKHAHCSFEHAYFAKPEATIEGVKVAVVRKNLGISLAKKLREAAVKIDLVIPIPETGRETAKAIAEELHLPFVDAISKKDSLPRSFLINCQKKRELALTDWFQLSDSKIKGKNILIVDDSIVRGSVSKQVTKLFKQAGAMHIYLASSYPVIKHPCRFGINFATQEELISNGRTQEEMAKAIGVDTLFFNEPGEIDQALGFEDSCRFCTLGINPT